MSAAPPDPELERLNAWLSARKDMRGYVLARLSTIRNADTLPEETMDKLRSYMALLKAAVPPAPRQDKLPTDLGMGGKKATESLFAQHAAKQAAESVIAWPDLAEFVRLVGVATEPREAAEARKSAAKRAHVLLDTYDDFVGHVQTTRPRPTSPVGYD
jgi:hypothetical protein